MSWTGVITDVGVGMMEQVVGGASLTFTSVQTGAGTTDNMAGATSVSTPKGTGSMTSGVESDGVRIKMRIPAGSEAYTMKQVGLFARIGSGSPALFALMQDSTGVSIPAANDFPDFIYNMSTFLAVSNTDNVSVTVDTSAVVSMSDLEEAMEHVVTLERNFYASSSSVSVPLAANGKTYLIYTAKSSGNNAVMDAANGCLIFVANGVYGEIFKGTGITVSVSGNTLTVSCSSSVKMGTIEI